MNKLGIGLLIIGILLITGCDKGTGFKDQSKPKKELITKEKFEGLMKSDDRLYIQREIYGKDLTDDQKKNINKKISDMKEAHRKIMEENAEKVKKQRLKEGNWKHRYFVDKFGDKTKDDYITLSIKDAAFSNSATVNSRLEGDIIITKGAYRFDTYEYGRSGNSSAKFIDGGMGYFKNSKGETLVFTIDKNLMITRYSNDYEYQRIDKFLRRSKGDVKVVLEAKYGTKHSFSFNSNGYVYNYGKLK